MGLWGHGGGVRGHTLEVGGCLVNGGCVGGVNGLVQEALHVPDTKAVDLEAQLLWV